MIQIENDGIHYLKFENFGSEITQAIFKRHGGVSPEPWASLNMGGTVGDDTLRVMENKRRALDKLGITTNSIFDVWQVHGTNVIKTCKPRDLKKTHARADAIITDTPGITLLMRFADCVPIFLYDPVRKVIGLAHAGWKGTIEGIVANTINAMQAEFLTKPENIFAGLGPSIGPDHYQIGDDLAERVRSVFREDEGSVLHNMEGKIYFNLWAANYLNLRRSGVFQIENSRVCTACNPGDWYSYRGEHGTTGRFGVILSI